MPGILHDVTATVHHYGLLKPKETVLVGCSGGPDSIALFHLLREMAGKYELSLVMAHLNHGIRKEADADEAFVRRLAETEGIRMVTEKVNCPALSKEWKVSLESAARKARYAFFESHAKALKASKVALGHTADDQAETILMRLLRGAGLKRLAGMFPITCRKGVYFIRPLIRCQKSDVLAYLASRNLAYRTDETNLAPCCTRNKIRLNLMPFLEKEFNPSIVRTLSQTAELIREDHDLLEHVMSNLERRLGIDFKKARSEQVVRKEYPWTAGFEEEAHYIDLDKIRSQPMGIQRRIIQKWLSVFSIHPRRIHYQHIQAITNLINRSEGGGELSLPGGVSIYREAGQLCLTVHAPRHSKKDRMPEEDICLNIPGITRVPRFSAILKTSLLSKKELTEISSDPNIAFLDADTLQEPISVRSRLPGDRFQPLGIPVEKKLKEFFIDSKVPRRMRDQWPLLSGGSKIFWILGLRIGHPYRITSHTQKVLRVEFDFSHMTS